MQDTMMSEVNSKAREMFASADQYISAEFAVLVTHIATDARCCTTETIKTLEEDFTNIFGGTIGGIEEDMKKIATTKESLSQVLAKVDEQFSAIGVEEMEDEAVEIAKPMLTETEKVATEDDQGEKEPEIIPTDPETPIST